MKLFLYYAAHAIKNQLKKLFKTWVAVFIVICVVFGLLFGLGAGLLADSLDGDTDTSDTSYSDSVSNGETAEPSEDDDHPSQEEMLPILELAIAALILVMLLWNVLVADKSGGQIFQMADVNLLFPAPMKPQSVLLFRLLSQLGAILVASLYLLFQMPNLTLNMGLHWTTAISLLVTWFLLLAYTKLVNVLLYTVSSTHESIKPRIRPVAYACVGVLFASFVLYWKSGTLPLIDATVNFFNAPWTRMIPVYGWLKGLSLYVAEGNWIAAGACLAALLVGIVLFVWLIWHIKADFYEDAMQRSAETAEAKQAAASGRKTDVRRKKDRSDRLQRDGLNRGCGANMYFYKAMYNRFRFSHFGVLTKTGETYLVAAVGVCAFMTFVVDYASLIPVALILAAFCFFRSLGNPLSTDIQQDSFRMVPETARSKVFYSLLGGSLNCALDLIPALLVATVWMRANPLTTLLWLLFAVTMDFYSANVGLFLDLAIPVNAGKIIKQMIQIMFVYFGLGPAAVLIILGFVLNLVPLFMVLAAVLNMAIGFLFFAISPPLIERGQK